MKNLIHFINKYAICPLLVACFATGVIFTIIGIYNSLNGNDTSGEFTYGLPLIVIGLVSLVIAKVQTKNSEESIMKFLGEGIFWALSL